jgi:hypothetical protein
MSDTVKVYIDTNTALEIHRVGEAVAVCFNLERIEETRPVGRGKHLYSVSWERTGEPFIDFPILCDMDDEEGECYVDEDSFVEGGIDTAQAVLLLKELPLALAYIESRAWEDK